MDYKNVSWQEPENKNQYAIILSWSWSWSQFEHNMKRIGGSSSKLGIKKNK